MSRLYDQTQRTIGSSNDGASAARIKNKILSDFYHHGGILENFHNDLYDEPTYLSFRVEFIFEDPTNKENLNDLPMPLFEIGNMTTQTSAENDIAKFRNSILSQEGYDDESAATAISNYQNKVQNKINTYTSKSGYSTYCYLLNQKEDVRAELLLSLINNLKDIQTSYPYYFKSIEGIGNLLKIDTKSGRRLKEGENILTIKCLEGLDLKIDEITNLYRKIAWDDVYQRWVLPDMMRFFRMKIYVSEIRNFHTTSNAPSQTGKYTATTSSLPSNSLVNQLINQSKVVDTVKSIVNSVKSTISSFTKKTTADEFTLINQEFNNYMPTLCITCDQCEFVIDDIMNHLSNLSSSNKTALDDVQIRIKVGNIMESQYYPLDSNNMADIDKHIALLDEQLYRPTKTPWSSKKTEIGYLAGDANNRNYFINSSDDKYTVFQATTTGGLLNSVVADIVQKAAKSVYKAADNYASNQLNKLLNTGIGNTGLTAQGLMNAIGSRNVVAMYSYVRDAINQQVNAATASAATNSSAERLGDEAFKDVLKEIANIPDSYATDDERNMIKVAGIISDASMNSIDLNYFFEMFKDLDFSKTDTIEKLKVMMSADHKSVIETIAAQTAADHDSIIEAVGAQTVTKNTNITSPSFQQYSIDSPIHDETLNRKSGTDRTKLIHQEFNEVVSSLRKLALSTATDSDSKRVMLLVYNKLKQYSDAASSSLQNKIEKIMDTAEESETRDALWKFLELSKKYDNLEQAFKDQQEEYNSLPLSEAIENEYYTNSILDPDINETRETSEMFNPEIDETRETSEIFKANIDAEVIHEDIDSYSDQKEEYNSLPLSEAVENQYSTNDMTSVEIEDVEKTSNIDGYDDLQDEYESLPMSEAVENQYYTNEILDPDINVSEESSEIFKPEIEEGTKQTELIGYEDENDKYKSLPMSEAVENQYSTNDIVTSPIDDENDAEISDKSIDGFEDLQSDDTLVVHDEVVKPNIDTTVVHDVIETPEINANVSHEAIANPDIDTTVVHDVIETPDINDEVIHDEVVKPDIDSNLYHEDVFSPEDPVIDAKPSNISGYEDLKSIQQEPPMSEATENTSDEMNHSDRTKIQSEYSDLKTKNR